MKKPSTALARVVAFTALVAAFLVVVVVVSNTLGGSDPASEHRSKTEQAAKRRAKAEIPRAYVVQNGDTLTSIARDVGVSVVRIETLNPGIDPQILISGEKLKLR